MVVWTAAQIYPFMGTAAENEATSQDDNGDDISRQHWLQACNNCCSRTWTTLALRCWLC